MENKIEQPVSQASGKGFFVRRDGYALALCDEPEEAVKNPVFAEQMGDIIAYRTMEYYKRRYREGRLQS